MNKFVSLFLFSVLVAGLAGAAEPGAVSSPSDTVSLTINFNSKALLGADGKALRGVSPGEEALRSDYAYFNQKILLDGKEIKCEKNDKICSLQLDSSGKFISGVKLAVKKGNRKVFLQLSRKIDWSIANEEKGGYDTQYSSEPRYFALGYASIGQKESNVDKDTELTLPKDFENEKERAAAVYMSTNADKFSALKPVYLKPSFAIYNYWNLPAANVTVDRVIYDKDAYVELAKGTDFKTTPYQTRGQLEGKLSKKIVLSSDYPRGEYQNVMDSLSGMSSQYETQDKQQEKPKAPSPNTLFYLKRAPATIEYPQIRWSGKIVEGEEYAYAPNGAYVFSIFMKDETAGVNDKGTFAKSLVFNMTDSTGIGQYELERKPGKFTFGNYVFNFVDFSGSKATLTVSGGKDEKYLLDGIGADDIASENRGYAINFNAIRSFNNGDLTFILTEGKGASKGKIILTVLQKQKTAALKPEAKKKTLIEYFGANLLMETDGNGKLVPKKTGTGFPPQVKQYAVELKFKLNAKATVSIKVTSPQLGANGLPIIVFDDSNEPSTGKWIYDPTANLRVSDFNVEVSIGQTLYEGSYLVTLTAVPDPSVKGFMNDERTTSFYYRAPSPEELPVDKTIPGPNLGGAPSYTPPPGPQLQPATLIKNTQVVKYATAPPADLRVWAEFSDFNSLTEATVIVNFETGPAGQITTREFKKSKNELKEPSNFNSPWRYVDVPAAFKVSSGKQVATTYVVTVYAYSRSPAGYEVSVPISGSLTPPRGQVPPLPQGTGSKQPCGGAVAFEFFNPLKDQKSVTASGWFPYEVYSRTGKCYLKNSGPTGAAFIPAADFNAVKTLVASLSASANLPLPKLCADAREECYIDAFDKKTASGTSGETLQDMCAKNSGKLEHADDATARLTAVNHRKNQCVGKQYQVTAPAQTTMSQTSVYPCTADYPKKIQSTEECRPLDAAINAINAEAQGLRGTNINDRETRALSLEAVSNGLTVFCRRQADENQCNAARFVNNNLDLGTLGTDDAQFMQNRQLCNWVTQKAIYEVTCEFKPILQRP